jgi:hypothetical protein
VDEDHGSPLVEEGEQAVEGRVAEVDPGVVGQEHDAIGLEHIEGVGRLSDGAINIGQRQGGEEAEAIWLRRHDSRSELVDPPRPVARLRPVAKPDARGGQREDGGANTVLVQDFCCHWRRPTRQGYAARLDSLVAQEERIVRWDDVVVDIDPGRMRRHTGTPPRTRPWVSGRSRVRTEASLSGVTTAKVYLSGRTGPPSPAECHCATATFPRPVR